MCVCVSGCLPHCVYLFTIDDFVFLRLAPEMYVCVLECVLAMEGVCGYGFCVSLGVCLKTSVVECAFVLVV